MSAEMDGATRNASAQTQCKAYAGMSGGSSKKEKPSVDKVPLNAESAYVACLYTNNSDEEAFIKQFLAEAAKEDSK